MNHSEIVKFLIIARYLSAQICTFERQMFSRFRLVFCPSALFYGSGSRKPKCCGSKALGGERGGQGSEREKLFLTMNTQREKSSLI